MIYRRQKGYVSFLNGMEAIKKEVFCLSVQVDFDAINVYLQALLATASQQVELAQSFENLRDRSAVSLYIPQKQQTRNF